MRLSVYNGSDLRNVIYVLHDEPLAVNSLNPEFVVRQIPGRQLLANMTRLLPVRVVGAKLVNGRIDIPKRVLLARRQQRDPAPVNGLARSLIASDLLSVRFNRLNHPHEDFAKSLTAISERLGLRSPQVERLTDEAANGAQKQKEPHPLAYLNHMTLTVIDGDFPRPVLADANLTFSEFHMNALRNTPNHYHAPTAAPARTPPGMLLQSSVPREKPRIRSNTVAQDRTFGPPQHLPHRGRQTAWVLACVCVALIRGSWSGRSR
jgi:hypothetical protein